MKTKTIIMLTAALALAAQGGCEKDGNPVRPGEPVEPPPADVTIHYPLYTPGRVPTYGEVIRFGWSAPQDNRPAGIRYFASQVTDTNGVYNPAFNIIGDLNANPWRYEGRWSRWIAYDAPGDSGIATLVGDDEELFVGRLHILALQARNDDGEVTSVFSEPKNVRRFVVSPQQGPLLTITEDRLRYYRFLGLNLNPERMALPPGVPLRFRWRADASFYAGVTGGYRHAWDVADFGAWDAPFVPGDTISDTVLLHAGVHMLSVEAADLAGTVTRGRIEVTVAPFPMDRNLLWVDDFFTTADTVPDYSTPPEASHDEFWKDLCSNASGFDPERDVYDSAAQGFRAPSVELLGRYKNIVWTYSRSGTSWEEIVYFVPESLSGNINYKIIDHLPFFLLKGGHLWTSGRSDRGGGLAAVLDGDARIFPIHLACEITGARADCGGDRSGVRTLPYRDYCVTVIDKIEGSFRNDDEMPLRRVSHYDVMMHAYRDDGDAVTASHPALPRRLDLWEEVTLPGRYFDPDSSSTRGGFTYVEIYDPAYWMSARRIAGQVCFHPIYRMRAKNPYSAVDDAAVAVWITKYADVVPEVSSGTAAAAPSIHFGFPLWFFRRESADSIAEEVFETWRIRDGG